MLDKIATTYWAPIVRTGAPIQVQYKAILDENGETKQDNPIFYWDRDTDTPFLAHKAYVNDSKRGVFLDFGYSTHMRAACAKSAYSPSKVLYGDNLQNIGFNGLCEAYNKAQGILSETLTGYSKAALHRLDQGVNFDLENPCHYYLAALSLMPENDKMQCRNFYDKTTGLHETVLYANKSRHFIIYDKMKELTGKSGKKLRFETRFLNGTVLYRKGLRKPETVTNEKIYKKNVNQFFHILSDNISQLKASAYAPALTMDNYKEIIRHFKDSAGRYWFREMMNFYGRAYLSEKVGAQASFLKALQDQFKDSKQLSRVKKVFQEIKIDRASVPAHIVEELQDNINLWRTKLLI